MSRRRRRRGCLFICAAAVLYPAYWVLAGTVLACWHMLRFMSFLVFGRPRIIPLGGLRRALTRGLRL